MNLLEIYSPSLSHDPRFHSPSQNPLSHAKFYLLHLPTNVPSVLPTQISLVRK